MVDLAVLYLTYFCSLFPLQVWVNFLSSFIFCSNRPIWGLWSFVDDIRTVVYTCFGDVCFLSCETWLLYSGVIRAWDIFQMENLRKWKRTSTHISIRYPNGVYRRMIFFFFLINRMRISKGIFFLWNFKSIYISPSNFIVAKSDEYD